MPKKDCPRLIFIRHGQTDWSKSGQYTSRTDLHLTPYGVKQAELLGEVLIGTSETSLVNINKVKKIISSPRSRAIQTKDLVLQHLDPEITKSIPFEINEDIREWEYGDYEGLKTKEIIDLRAKRGLPNKLNTETGEPIPWSIWTEGCENGEDSTRVTLRLKRLIKSIRSFHEDALANDEDCDILIFGHGHILRCLAAIWLGRDININPQFILDTSGVGVLSYQHHNLNEPAIVLSGPFTVPMEEEIGHAV